MKTIAGGRSRASGLVVLLVAALAVLLAPSLLGDGLPGSPTRAPLPGPPAVGSCVDLQRGQAVAVPCEGPHLGEVAASWAADVDVPLCRDTAFCGSYGDPGALIQQYLNLPPTTVGRLSTCYAAVDDYLFGAAGARSRWSADGHWRPVFPQRAELEVPAPNNQRAGAHGWTACVVTASNRLPYSGRVGGAADGVALPNVYAACLEYRDLVTDSTCEAAHRMEVFGQYAFADSEHGNGPPHVGITQDELVASCTSWLGTVLGVDDVTFGGQLRIGVDDRLLGSGIPVQGNAGPGGTVGYYPSCYLEVVDENRYLTGSLVGLAGSPLPLV